jgi:tRNA 2-thiouridine synthesizing protein E
MVESISSYLNPGKKNVNDPMFPNAPEGWTRATAEAVAAGDGLSLKEDHWQVIQALQNYYIRHERPQARDLHDALEEKFHTLGGIRYLYQLLPKGPVAQGCKLAGLQAPAGATDEHFGSVQ